MRLFPRFGATVRTLRCRAIGPYSLASSGDSPDIRPRYSMPLRFVTRATAWVLPCSTLCRVCRMTCCIDAGRIVQKDHDIAEYTDAVQQSHDSSMIVFEPSHYNKAWATARSPYAPRPNTRGMPASCLKEARVAKSADAKDLKSFFRQRECGFKSHPGHHSKINNLRILFKFIGRVSDHRIRNAWRTVSQAEDWQLGMGSCAGRGASVGSLLSWEGRAPENAPESAARSRTRESRRSRKRWRH